MCTVSLFLIDRMILQLIMRLCKHELNVMMHSPESARVYLPTVAREKYFQSLYSSCRCKDFLLYSYDVIKENAVSESHTIKVVELPLSPCSF